MANTFVALATITVGSGGASSMDFTNIPQTFTDLLIKISARGSYTGVQVRFNNDTGTNYTWIALKAAGAAGIGSENQTTFGTGYNTFIYMRTAVPSGATANAFGNGELYIPNYISSQSKTASMNSVADNNPSANSLSVITAGNWSGTSAITQITLNMDASGSFDQYTSATLYGIKNS